MSKQKQNKKLNKYCNIIHHNGCFRLLPRLFESLIISHFLLLNVRVLLRFFNAIWRFRIPRIILLHEILDRHSSWFILDFKCLLPTHPFGVNCILYSLLSDLSSGVRCSLILEAHRAFMAKPFRIFHCSVPMNCSLHAIACTLPVVMIGILPPWAKEKINKQIYRIFNDTLSGRNLEYKWGRSVIGCANRFSWIPGISLLL